MDVDPPAQSSSAQDPPASHPKKLLRSCNACRSSKTRCLPDAENDETCQRCRRLQKSCVFSEARGRSKGVKRFPHSKLADVEKRINDIYAFVSNQGTAPRPPPAAQPPPTSLGESPVIVEGSGESVEPSPVHVSSLVSPVTNAATISSTSGGDVIERGLITVSDAEAAMWHFEKEISSNSFVWPVGLGFDVPSLRFNHPTLFVAALIAGGHGMPKFRAALEQDLKETIARRMIVDVSKDLDLLLGLLLHLLWYNHYPYEDHNQLYTYVYLVVLLLNDLNVHGLAMSSSDPNEKLDMCRVYLTTYLMSTCITSTIRKPWAFYYNEHVAGCLKVLAQLSDEPSDEVLIRSVQLQHVKENITSSFYYDNPTEHVLNIDTVELQIKSFDRELQTIKDSSHVEDDHMSACLDLATQHAWVVLYEVALHLRDPTETQGMVSTGESPLVSIATRRRNLLYQCLEKTKTWMENYAQFPNYQFERTVTIYTSQLAYTAMILLKLTFNTTDATPENPFPFRKMCDLLGYAKKFADPCREHDRSTCGEQCIANDLMNIYRDKARLTVNWFERLEILNTTEGAENLQGMSSLHLEQIPRQEQQLLSTDWSTIDFSQLDMSQMMM